MAMNLSSTGPAGMATWMNSWISLGYKHPSSTKYCIKTHIASEGDLPSSRNLAWGFNQNTLNPYKHQDATSTLFFALPVGCFHPTCAHPLAHTSTRWVSPGMQPNPHVMDHGHVPLNVSWNICQNKTSERLLKSCKKKCVKKKCGKKTPETWNHPQKNALMASWCTATPFGFDSAMYGGFSKDPMGCANPEKSSEGKNGCLMNNSPDDIILRTLPLSLKQLSWNFKVRSL